MISSWTRTRPSPEHLGHGCSMMEPSPWHRSHAVTLMSWPNTDRCTERTCPDPPHTGQIFVELPGLAPEALHSVHGTMRRILITFWALLTGFRCSTSITIRADGLVWNDRAFFPASHVLMISYGTTSNTGKPGERFEPLLQIQLGVKTVLLAEYLEPVSAKLFEHLFRDDTRRYWHGHN